MASVLAPSKHFVFNRMVTKKHKQSQVWELHDHALKKSVQNWRTVLNMPSGVEALLSEAYLSQIIRFLKVHRAEHPHYRVAFCVMVTWTANPTEDFTAIKTIPVRTCSETVMLGSNLRRISINLIQDLMKRLEDFEHNGSGYVLQEVLSLDLEIFNFSAHILGETSKLFQIRQKTSMINYAHFG